MAVVLEGLSGADPDLLEAQRTPYPPQLVLGQQDDDGIFFKKFEDIEDHHQLYIYWDAAQL
jgi:hypothetical protein